MLNHDGGNPCCGHAPDGDSLIAYAPRFPMFGKRTNFVSKDWKSAKRRQRNQQQRSGDGRSRVDLPRHLTDIVHAFMNIHTKMPLAKLPVGSWARIVSLDVAPAEAQRLMEMGLLRGTRVRVARRAPFGDPLQLELRHTALSLRKHTAAKITVELEPAA